ncbi:MAG: cytochrome c [Halofilum sp. (in: g-proteobacteria)]|nr:cytochrome c [Halofilum sp. (in: g-proteobacteria)]
MKRADAGAIYAYLQSLEPVTRAVAPHELRFPYGFRVLLWPWRWLYFEAGAYEPDPQRGERWNRGAYLVRHLGHCGECHTPRNWMGAKIEARHLAGNPDGPEGNSVPNITPHPEDGIGEWSRVDLTFFLETGFQPDGDVAGGGMGAVVSDSTGRLTAADREAIAEYLMGLEPLPSKAGGE